MHTTISKYGGSSITQESDVARIERITSDDPMRRYIVISAPGARSKSEKKVTQLLVALSGQQKPSDALLDEIIDRYERIYPSCADTVRNALRERLHATYSCANARTDSLKAFGEDMNARLLARALGAAYTDPREFLFVTPEFGNARVLAQSYDAMSALRSRNGILVFPGFFGYTASGEAATFSFGGSDLSGAVLARGLGCTTYENFTDSAILAADPSLVENPHPIKELTYRELRDLSYSGFSIFHQEAMFPIEGTGIVTHVRSTRAYPEEGTHVVQERVHDSHHPIVGIAYKPGFCSFSVEKSGLNEAVGVLYRLLGVFYNHNISVEFPAVGIDDISIIANQNAVEREGVNTIQEEIYGIIGRDRAHVSFREHLGCLVVAGKGLARDRRISGEIEILLGEHHVEVRPISRGVEKRCLMYGIDMEDGPRAVRAIYDRYLRS